jgi:hypothetical protein
MNDSLIKSITDSICDAMCEAYLEGISYSKIRFVKYDIVLVGVSSSSSFVV